MSAGSDYAVVHLVTQEGHKDLIGPQVVDPLAVQLASDAEGAPSLALVVLLEAARHAVSADMRRRAALLRERAPDVALRIVPFVSRLGIERNARWIAPLIARSARGLPVVLHCRGEGAARWARAMRPHLRAAGIVLDVRGASPEEMLFERGFDGPSAADPASRAVYEAACDEVRLAASSADAVIATSDGLIDWMHSIGVERHDMGMVPCCVPRVVFDERDRAEVRRTLGIEDKLVIAYSGTTSAYQHLADGFAPMVADAMVAAADVHALCVTPDPGAVRSILDAAGVAPERATVITASQRHVGRYLCAADGAVLLRRATRMNKVARPIKLGEYLSSGAPVIVSRMRGGWECAAIVEDAEAGTAVDWFDEPREVQRQAAATVVQKLRDRGAAMRWRAIELCKRDFTWPAFAAVTREAYARARRASTVDARMPAEQQRGIER